MAVQGDVIAERYRLERKLGEGAMGTVWLAQHLMLGTHVAIKLMAQQGARSEQALARFEQEARIAARIKSANVVTIMDHGRHEGLPFIVMELLEGQSLREVLAQHGRLSLFDTANLVRQVARALSHAHGMGLVHRDIKPENVFVTQGDEGEAVFKVLDFGVVKVTDQLLHGGLPPTQTGAMVGTPYYMSPEQAAGLKSLDHRADLWSLGVLAFECLTGMLPFDAPSLGQLIAQIHDHPIPRPTQIVAGLPPAVDIWMERALQRVVAARFESAKIMGDSLAAIAGIGPGADSGAYPAPAAPAYGAPQREGAWEPSGMPPSLQGAPIAPAYGAAAELAATAASGLDPSHSWSQPAVSPSHPPPPMHPGVAPYPASPSYPPPPVAPGAAPAYPAPPMMHPGTYPAPQLPPQGPGWPAVDPRMGSFEAVAAEPHHPPTRRLQIAIIATAIVTLLGGGGVAGWLLLKGGDGEETRSSAKAKSEASDEGEKAARDDSEAEDAEPDEAPAGSETASADEEDEPAGDDAAADETPPAVEQPPKVAPKTVTPQPPVRPPPKPLPPSEPPSKLPPPPKPDTPWTHRKDL